MFPNNTSYPRFEYWQSANDRKWYWHLQAANYRIIGDGGQGYSGEAEVKQAISRYIATVATASQKTIAHV